MACPVQADNVEDFLHIVQIDGQEQYQRLSVMLHEFEEFTVEDRAIMCLYLELLNDKNALDKVLTCDEDICFECVALQNAK